MVSTVGIDSRSFVRITKKTDGTQGNFNSVIGVAIKVRDYIKFTEKYIDAIAKSKKSLLKKDNDLRFYCFNDLKDCENPYQLLVNFFKEIEPHIEKIHIFYTLFSKKRLSKVKVYGRLSHRLKLKLSEPTRNYEDLLSQHILQCFPAICAWRLTEFFNPDTVQFHLDYYSGHIFEAQESLDDSNFIIKVYPGGDCVNSVISTADLFIELLDQRLLRNDKFLLFENIRPVLTEFGDKVMVYPISNKHLSYITPLDKKPIELGNKIKHPVFWIFKGEEILGSGLVKRSESYRLLQDYVSNSFGVVKMFEKSKDIDFFEVGDFGVYLNTRGREQIESYQKIGKKFKLFNFDNIVPKSWEKG
ncbi:hypothetical protein HZB88_03015 [archaeon]|nr:hypothetical protein [archaeon]